jgi:hypothetical protein
VDKGGKHLVSKYREPSTNLPIWGKVWVGKANKLDVQEGKHIVTDILKQF